MNQFVLNLLLAILWMFMWGAFDAYTLLTGFVLGYLLLGLAGKTVTGSNYGRRVWDVLSFALYFIRILVKANWQVAKIVLSPSMPIAPRLMRYDVSGLTPAQITTLANAITLTPGTLVVDIDPDGRLLYIHGITAADREQAVRELDELRDRLLKEVFGR
jgi:multicomponent Na+:H+ antiporter subunit E